RPQCRNPPRARREWPAAAHDRPGSRMPMRVRSWRGRREAGKRKVEHFSSSCEVDCAIGLQRVDDDGTIPADAQQLAQPNAIELRIEAQRDVWSESKPRRLVR